MQLKFCFISILLILIVNVSKVRTDDDEDSGDDEARPRSCQKYVFDFIYGIIKSTLKCLGGQSTFKMNSIFELQTRASCLLKCTLQEEGIVDLSTGLFDDIAAAFYFEENFDQAVKDITLPESQPCFELAGQFNPKEYWCKSYLPFIECSFRAILKGLIPYIGDCIANPTIGILFSVIKYLAPDSPKLAEDAEAMRRSFGKNISPIKCLDPPNCTRKYEYKMVNGTQSMVIYDKDENVLKVENRKTKPKPIDSVPNSITNTRSGGGGGSGYKYNSFGAYNYTSNKYSYTSPFSSNYTSKYKYSSPYNGNYNNYGKYR